MLKKDVLPEEAMRKVSGGIWYPKSVSMDTRWDRYVHDKKIAFKNKQQEEETKRVWIKTGFQLASDVLAGLTDIGGAAIKGGQTAASKPKDAGAAPAAGA